MKTNVKVVFLLIVLLFASVAARAQALTVLANFNGGNGANPQAGLVTAGTNFYGVAYAGGSSNFGTIFSLNTNGGNISVLYSFYGAVYNTNTGSYSTTDGAYPSGGLVFAGAFLYGTTYAGGSSDDGTIFLINTNGKDYFILHSFTGGSGGANPDAGLLLASSNLYGTTMLGGAEGQGAIFRMNTNGTLFTNIYSFTGGTNGANPQGSLVLSGNTLYGTTYGPYFNQSSGYGTVFKVNTDGSSFSNIYSFTNGADGANPAAGLVLSGNTLYGTASTGGQFLGTVFAVNTNGSGFVSYPFTGDNGANPQGNLILAGSTLAGAAPNGGSNGWGTVFEISTSGGPITPIYTFTDEADGGSPEAELLLLGNTLYGTTEADDSYGAEGTVFALPAPAVVAIPLNITSQGGEVTLTWSSTSFSLQSATNLTGPYTNVPNAASPYTTTLPGQQQFFRLQGN